MVKSSLTLKGAFSSVEASRTWPVRYTDVELGEGEKEYENLLKAKMHYKTVWFSATEEYHLGDIVRMTMDEDKFCLVRIDELFVLREDQTDPRGKDLPKGAFKEPFFMGGTYLWLKSETFQVSLDELSNKHVFWATPKANKRFLYTHHVGSIERKVNVHFLLPNYPIPDVSGPDDYFCDSSYDPTFRTFRDLPCEGLDKECAASKAARVKELILNEPTLRKQPEKLKMLLAEPELPVVIRVLELCAGVGGLGFLAQTGPKHPQHPELDMEIATRWSVDIDEDASATMQVNHTGIQVMCKGMDVVLILSKKIYQDVWPKFVAEPVKQRASKWVEAVHEVDLEDCAPRGTLGQCKGHLLDNLSKKQSWLKYRVSMRRDSPVTKFLLDLQKRAPIVPSGQAVRTISYKGEVSRLKEKHGRTAGPLAADPGEAEDEDMLDRDYARKNRKQSNGSGKREFPLSTLDYYQGKERKSHSPALIAAAAAGDLHANKKIATANTAAANTDRTRLKAVTAIAAEHRHWPLKDGLTARDALVAAIKSRPDHLTENLEDNNVDCAGLWEVEDKLDDLHKEFKIKQQNLIRGGSTKEVQEEAEDKYKWHQRHALIKRDLMILHLGRRWREIQQLMLLLDNESSAPKTRPQPNEMPELVVQLWVPDYLLDLLDAGYQTQEFLRKVVTTMSIPGPGHVDMIAGGPPCQGLSGLNIHSAKTDILDDPKNRLINVYMEFVEYYRPKFTLTEQVTDSLKKEGAAYQKYLVGRLLELRYQVRLGVLTAGDYGCAQGRLRVITIGAAQGFQLPPFPEPTHRCLSHGINAPVDFNDCHIKFLSPASMDAAHPHVTLGDVLSDLPDVSNYEMREQVLYKTDPTRPAQHFLRRNPGVKEPCKMSKMIAAGEVMLPGMVDTLSTQLQKFIAGGLAGVGRTVKCHKGEGNKGYSSQVAQQLRNLVKDNRLLQKGLEVLIADKETKITTSVGAELAGSAWGSVLEGPVALALEVLSESKPLAEETTSVTPGSGKRRAGAAASPGSAKRRRAGPAKTAANAGVVGTLAKADASKPLPQLPQGSMDAAVGSLQALVGIMNGRYQAMDGVRDHRPLNNNIDDHLRMLAVPRKKGASFRELPGVVTNENGSCCGGHRHAPCGPAGCTRPEFGDAADAVKKKGGRVDEYDKANDRYMHRPGCKSATVHTDTNDLLCARWCLTYKGGKSGAAAAKVTAQFGDGNISRTVCFGRLALDESQSTVVTRAEPHNLRIIHPTQHRVMSIRENARCQGFPDHWVFLAFGAPMGRGENSTLGKRYRQVGNAVAPPMAAALGRGFMVAMANHCNHKLVDVPVMKLPDHDWDNAHALAETKSHRAYAVEKNLRHNIRSSKAINERRALAAAAAKALAAASAGKRKAGEAALAGTAKPGEKRKAGAGAAGPTASKVLKTPAAGPSGSKGPSGQAAGPSGSKSRPGQAATKQPTPGPARGRSSGPAPVPKPVSPSAGLFSALLGRAAPVGRCRLPIHDDASDSGPEASESEPEASDDADEETAPAVAVVARARAPARAVEASDYESSEDPYDEPVQEGVLNYEVAAAGGAAEESDQEVQEEEEEDEEDEEEEESEEEEQ